MTVLMAVTLPEYNIGHVAVIVEIKGWCSNMTTAKTSARRSTVSVEYYVQGMK